MKTGFVVSFFDQRNDIRKLISIASRSGDLIVFAKQKDADLISKHLPNTLTLRIIDEKKRTLFNSLWQRIYFMIRSIPESRNNFFLMEYFKLSQTTSLRQRRKNYFWYWLLEKLPKFISYDFYLNLLQTTQKTALHDIDQFIFFTPIADDYFLARLLRENYPVKVYVYSWDHPCKHTCFSQRVHYLIGNKQLQKLLSRLQKLPLNKISITGLSQLSYLHLYQSNPTLPTPSYPLPYFYFGCAIGIPELVIDEVDLIQAMAVLLQTERPGMVLMVRPYPFLTDPRPYQKLRMLPNVVMDDHYRSSDSAISESDILDKLHKLKHAVAFFHCGTTMGLEACLLDTPSFLVAPEPTPANRLSLYNFAHQYQNAEFLTKVSPVNTLTSFASIKEILLCENFSPYKKLNEQIRQQFPINPFEQIAHQLIHLPESNSNPNESPD